MHGSLPKELPSSISPVSCEEVKQHLKCTLCLQAGPTFDRTAGPLQSNLYARQGLMPVQQSSSIFGQLNSHGHLLCSVSFVS